MCDDRTVFVVEHQSFLQFADPCVDYKLKRDEVIGLDQKMGPVGAEGRERGAHSNLAVSRVAHTMAIE